MFIHTYAYIIYVCFMLFAPWTNIIFDISTSKSIEISIIYAKKLQELDVRPQVNIYQKFSILGRKTRSHQAL